ncbi:MAG TPA: ABC transporter ATP-binding protein [Steroidobacteraceae bacterium]|nr:ABC transporter ATP-binding protein [Steroidobacteraceae bacterium]
MSLLSDIWGILTRPQRRLVVFAQLLSIAMALSTVTGIASIAPFFAVLGNPGAIQQNRYLHWLYVQSALSDARSFEVILGLGFVSLVLVSNLINAVGSFVIVKLVSSIGADLKSELFGEYLARPYAFHATTHSAVLFNNVMHETSRLTNDVLQNIFVVVTNLATGSLIVLSVLLLNPRVAVGMIAALAGGYLLIYLAVRKRLTQAGRVQSHHFTEQARVVNESFGAIKEIQILRIQDFFRASFRRSSKTYARSAANAQLIAQSPRYVMECVAVAGLVIVALFGSAREGGIGPWLGQFTFLGFAAYRLLPTFQQAFAAIVRIRGGLAGIATVIPHLQVARRKPVAASRSDSLLTECPRHGIELKEVCFRYTHDRKPAIDNLSMRIPARAIVGLVGSNGSGKTTIVDLVAGLIAPDTGSVIVDDTLLDDSNRAAWQSCIAYVPQNVFLLDTSIAENIALGISPASIDRHRLQLAAQLAQLDEFVAALPDTYQHRVGERGVKMSGGQRQRIGIARALYTSASVLVLDEATNALDGLTEQEFMSTLLRLRGRYTIVVVSHQLNMVRGCDVIFELEGGKIASSGTYTELMTSSESFKRLANAQ